MADKKVAIMVDEMYQVLEVWFPYYRFKEAGLEMNFVAAEAKKQYHSKVILVSQRLPLQMLMPTIMIV